ncbi:hypothetical protein Tco_0169800 [Tanacetum coccineum]
MVGLNLCRFFLQTMVAYLEKSDDYMLISAEIVDFLNAVVLHQSNEPPLSIVNTLGSGEDSMKLQELMDLCTKLSDRVLDLENVKDAQALEINKLKKRIKKLESEKKSRTPQLKRRLFKVRIESSAKKSLGDQEDSSKQGRNEVDQDEGISWFQEDSKTQGRYGYDIGVNTSSTSITTASINITTAEPVTTACAPITIAGVFKSENNTKAKGVIYESALVESGNKNFKIELDEEARLEREREEEASKAANITEWDDVQAMMDADYELATKLQEQERRIEGHLDDLVMMWSLVKEKFNSTEPIDDKEREIWVELKRLFEPDTNDDERIRTYMLVEKEYPLSRGTLTLMLVAKLLVDQDKEMSRELLRKIFMQKVNIKFRGGLLGLKGFLVLLKLMLLVMIVTTAG